MSYRDNPADTRAHTPPPDGGPRRPAARRIVIISASVGAGHDGAAGELARRLECEGFLVDRHDFLDLLPARSGKLLAGWYRRMLAWAPGAYQRIYGATEHRRRPGAAVRALLRSAERPTLRALPADTCAVVSTYPGASQVLGALRLRGLLSVPALTYLTDFSVHALWVAPGIDIHLAAHAIPAGQAREHGAAGVTVTGPVAAARFAPATEERRRAARIRFGLPAQAPLALLVAGSWGVGPVARVAAEIHATGAAVPVVVCGHNQALAARLRRAGLAHVYGWVADMPALMAAADVLVQNAGGLSSLEAFASGLPVTGYRCIPGHGQTNAAALHEAGLAYWIRESSDLEPVLTELLDGTLGRQQRDRGLALFGARPGPAEVIAAVAGRTAAARCATGRGRTRPTGRGPARRGVPAMAAAIAVTATVTLGIAAPLAEAYADAPTRFAALTHFLEEDRR